MINYFSLTLGYLSVVFHIAQFLAQDTRKMLIFGLLSTFLLGLHFMLDGTLLGFYAVILSIIVKITALLNYTKLSRIILILTPIMSFGYYLFLADSEETFLPALAMTFIAIADFQKDIFRMKLWYYGSVISWLLYGLYISSLPAILYDVLGLIFLTIGVFLAIRKKRSYNIVNN